VLKETLKKAVSGMKPKVPEAQRTRPINYIGKEATTAQRGDSPAQPFIQRFLWPLSKEKYEEPVRSNSWREKSHLLLDEI